ncbi:MAG: adenylyltransferase/cytidyltransferase family protein [bacterium]
MTILDKSYWLVDKILTVDEAEVLARDLKDKGKKLVTVNGAFDILHAGHLNFLGEAKEQGDVLFVGLNSDSSVREGKGEGRPIVSEQERAALVAALAYVDYVIIIDAPYDDVQNVMLRCVKPDIHVNGKEYGEPKKWIEWPVMREVGARGYAVPRRPGLATSDIIGKIKNIS